LLDFLFLRDGTLTNQKEVSCLETKADVEFHMCKTMDNLAVLFDVFTIITDKIGGGGDDDASLNGNSLHTLLCDFIMKLPVQ